jgi:hypothetical protein
MGLRLRLRAGVDVGGFPAQARVILQAMRTYGLVVADNGSSGSIGGVPDERWDNDALHQLGRITLADFETVDTAPRRIAPDSAAARGAVAATPARPAATRRPGPARPGAGPQALLQGVGRRSFVEPAAMAAARQGPAAAPTTAARPAGEAGPGLPAPLPLALAGLLGLVAAALATRVTLRRRPRPAGRHARAAARPGAGNGRPADPDRGTSLRR